MTPELQTLLDHMPVLHPGEVWLAGAGPGDPGHLTLFTLAGLLQAEVIVHDALVSPRILALAPAPAERIHAGKRGGRPSWQQADITGTLITLARQNRRVLRLKGGDPYVFGRGGEEALQLAASGIRFRVIPGITAGLGGLAAVGIPATLRGINQAVVLATGHDPDSADGSAIDWAALARLGQPIVLYMGYTHLEKIAAALMAGGLAGTTPAAAIAAATTSAEQVVVASLQTLHKEAAHARLATPMLIVIGHIVETRARLRQLLPEALEALQWPHAG